MLFFPGDRITQQFLVILYLVSWQPFNKHYLFMWQFKKLATLGYVSPSVP